MRRLLAKRWLWCVTVVLALLFCPLLLLCLYADPYSCVHPGMTEAEVSRLLGSASIVAADNTGPHHLGTVFTFEIRYRFWDIVTVTYAHGRVVETVKTARPPADVWQEFLYKVGWKTPPAPAPAAPPNGCIGAADRAPGSPRTETPAPAARP
jgi:hypothetical protein